MFLLIGGDSEIGAATGRRFQDRGVAVAATTRWRQRAGPDRPFLDLAAPLDDWRPPPATDAACIFAAVARLADCAADPSGSRRVNVEGTIALADRLLAAGAYVLFLSSNQVFDGSRPMVAADAPASPVSEYGRQKAAAEALLKERMAAGAAVGILRLAKVVSPGIALLRDWIAALSAGTAVRAFGDMMMAPVPIRLVAGAVAALLQTAAPGVFQLSGPRDLSYFDVARHLARRLGRDERLVEAASAYSIGLPEGSTPRHTTLDSSRLRQEHGLAAPDVNDVLGEVLAAAP